MKAIACAAIGTLALLAAKRADAAGCVPGAQIECACPGGVKGTQICDDDGKRYKPCKCEAPAPAVAPAPDPAPTKPAEAVAASSKTGAIHIGASPAGAVSIDGESKGKTPVDLANLSPGTYHVRVELEDGGEYEETVEVAAGETSRVFAQTSAAQIAFAARKGMKFGFSVGGGMSAVGEIDEFGDEPGGYGLAEGFASFGMSKTIDVRVGVKGMVGSGEALETTTMWGVPASVRFNLGSLYTMWVGAYVGLRTANPGLEKGYGPCSWDASHSCYNSDREHKGEFGLFASPEFSLATFRFGARRQFEVSLSHGISVPVTKSQDVDAKELIIFYNSVAFSMLFL